MKRIILILALLAALSQACSLSDLTGSGDEASTQNEPSPQSENRCGDKVCDGPENKQNCPDDCSEAGMIVNEVDNEEQETAPQEQPAQNEPA
ncbi:MAG: hypothetical protein MUO76_19720, partial [Anaerolineaceae bacterium]|nr:hypothetical protein [Anaerolineaceae bacterium]